MTALSDRLRCVLLVCSAAGVLPVLLQPAMGQEQPPPERPTVSIDLESLLTDARVTATSLEDPVWSVALDEGAELFQVPVQITPPAGSEPGTLDQPASGLAGARLLGWSIPPEEPDPSAPQAQATADAALAGPRIARDLVVRPDGRLSWQAERLGRDFEVLASGTGSASGSLYAYSLDYDLLRALRPEAPERAPRGADREEVRAANDAYREARDAYAALQDAVAALPERIEAPAADAVWLVYERRRPDGPLVFEVNGQKAWSIEPAAFKALRSLAGSTGNAAPSADDSVLRPDRLVTADEPLGAEAVALAAGRALAAGSGSSGPAADSPALALAEAVAARGPEAAARRLIAELVKAVPPTPTTVRLIAAAAPRAGDYGRVASLRARLLGLVGDTAGVPALETGRSVSELQRLLEDPEGPEVAELVDALADAAAGQPALADAAASGLRPERLPEPRLRALVDAVLRQTAEEATRDAAASAPRTPETPAAGVLLDRTLLRSFDPAVVRTTLTALEASAGGRSVISPALEALRSAITRSADGPKASGAGPPGEAATPPQLASGSILLSPADHGLIQQLRSGDQQVRDSAAAALRLFRLPESGGNRLGSDAEATLEALLTATGESAPAGLVILLSRSPDAPAVNEALLRLLARAQGAAATRVLFRLSGSERALGTALIALEPGERVAATASLLQAGADGPLAAGLALDAAGARFVGEELAAGRRVTAARLAFAVGDEARLLTLAGDPEPALARGAMAGLAAAAGADAAGQAASVAAMTEGGAAPAEAWLPLRERLRLAQLARAAGSYRLIVTTGPASPGAAEPGPGAVSVLPGRPAAGPGDAAPENAATKVRRVDLGVIVLSVTDEGLKMAGDPLDLSLAPDKPAIRLTNPLDLSNFPGEEILAVPLAAAEGPLDLLETPAGWRGRVPLGAGGELGVELIREGAALPPSAG